MAKTHQRPSLVDLPTPCLLAIMQQCSSDYRSLFNAAQAHSTLHAAAVAALSSITLQTEKQCTLKKILTYLTKYGQHVKHFSLSRNIPSGCSAPTMVELQRLPASMQLESLHLEDIHLDLLPSTRRKTGVLVKQPALKRLSLLYCVMWQDADGLAAALRQLPGLEYLHVAFPQEYPGDHFPFPGDVLPDLQQVTCLHLKGCTQNSTAYKHLSSLTNLEALHVGPQDTDVITAEMLAPLARLTSLRICALSENEDVYFQSAIIADKMILAGRSELQHLALQYMLPCGPQDNNVSESASDSDWELLVGADPALADSTKALLLELQHLQELRYLDLEGMLQFGAGGMPAVCYSTLTASSKLEHLDVSENVFPPSVWEHIFPTSRQLPYLQVMIVSRGSIEGSWPAWTAADVARLATCCPALWHLEAVGVLVARKAIAALSQISGLRHLVLGDMDGTQSWWKALVKLQGLKQLQFGLRNWGTPAWPVQSSAGRCSASIASKLVHLTQLTQLTQLKVGHPRGYGSMFETFECKDATRLPVWQQLQGYCTA